MLFRSLMPKIEELSRKYGLPLPTYGHAGDGNLHTTLVKPPEWTQEEWMSREKEVLRDLYAEVKALGGKLSGEHGIGSKRKSFLRDTLSETELLLMRKIKEAFDPKGIMNPGKIIDV